MPPTIAPRRSPLGSPRTRYPGHLPSGWRCTAATRSCRTFGAPAHPVASTLAPAPRRAFSSRPLDKRGAGDGDVAHESGRHHPSHLRLGWFRVADDPCPDCPLDLDLSGPSRPHPAVSSCTVPGTL